MAKQFCVARTQRKGKGHWKGGKCVATLNDTESAQSERKEWGSPSTSWTIPTQRYSTRNLLDSFASGFSSSVSEGCCWLSSSETSVVLPPDHPEQAVQIQQSLSFYDSDPHGSFSKADRFGLQRQHLCDEQQGSHKGEMFAGKACIFWWLSSSVLPERNRKEKATGTVESVWQLSTLLNWSSIAAEIRTTTSNY